jgi:hypothetical protein
VKRHHPEVLVKIDSRKGQEYWANDESFQDGCYTNYSYIVNIATLNIACERHCADQQDKRVCADSFSSKVLSM